MKQHTRCRLVCAAAAQLFLHGVSDPCWLSLASAAGQPLCLLASALRQASNVTDVCPCRWLLRAGMSLQAIKMIFEYLPRSYHNGAEDPVAREKMHNAATIAGACVLAVGVVQLLLWQGMKLQLVGALCACGRWACSQVGH